MHYNAGSSSADNYFDELMKFTKDLKEESERHIREGLTEDELELFDLLKKDKMTKEETQKVRLAAKSLLHRLREESPKVLVQDWFKDVAIQGVACGPPWNRSWTHICPRATTALSSPKSATMSSTRCSTTPVRG